MELQPSYPQNEAYSSQSPVIGESNYSVKKALNKVLVVADCFCLVSVVLLAFSIGTNYWYKVLDRNLGLWEECASNVCHPHEDNFTLWRAMQGLTIGAAGFEVLSLVLITLALCHMSPRCCATTSGVLLIFAFLMSGAVMAWFAVANFITIGGKTIGYSFVTCCISVALALIAGILAYVGTCAESNETKGVVITN